MDAARRVRSRLCFLEFSFLGELHRLLSCGGLEYAGNEQTSAAFTKNNDGARLSRFPVWVGFKMLVLEIRLKRPNTQVSHLPLLLTRDCKPGPANGRCALEIKSPDLYRQDSRRASYPVDDIQPKHSLEVMVSKSRPDPPAQFLQQIWVDQESSCRRCPTHADSCHDDLDLPCRFVVKAGD